MVASRSNRIPNKDSSIITVMDQPEEADSSEAKPSSQKLGIDIPSLNTSMYTDNSVELSTEEADIVEEHARSSLSNRLENKKTVTIYIPMDIQSIRNRNGRILDAEHSPTDGEKTEQNPVNSEQPREVMHTVSSKPSTDRTRPGSPRHSRIRSNSNLGAVTAQGKVLAQRPSVITRRRNPSVSASWIQSKDNKMRNTWSSRAEGNLSIKLVSIDSPISSPRKPSLNSLDIRLAAPPQYLRFRDRQRSFSPSRRSIAQPTYRKSDPQRFFPTTSQSSVDENREPSVTPMEPLSLYNPPQNVLSVSFGLDAEDLEPEDNNVIRMEVAPTRRHKTAQSISPKADEGQLIDVSDNSHAGSTVNVKEDFESLDLSNIDSCPGSVNSPVIDYSSDVQETLMELIDGSDMQHNWEGEELVGSHDDEENMLFYTDKPKDVPAIHEKEEVPEAVGEKKAGEGDIMSKDGEDQPSPILNEGVAVNGSSISSVDSLQSLQSLQSVESVPSDNCEELTPSPGLSLPEEEEEDTRPVSPLRHVDPLSFSITDYFSLSPEDRETAQQYRKQQEEAEQEYLKKVELMKQERERAAAPSVEESEESMAEDNSEEILRKFEEEFEKRMKKKEEEEEKKRNEIIEEANIWRSKWYADRRNQVDKEILKNRQLEERNQFDKHCRLLEFRYKFGDCANLLLPFIAVFDIIFGPCLKAYDDLLHPREVFINYVDELPWCKQLYSRAKALGIPRRRWDKWVRNEVKSSRFLEVLFSSFAFYYLCTLNYTIEKTKKSLPYSQ